MCRKEGRVKIDFHSQRCAKKNAQKRGQSENRFSLAGMRKKMRRKEVRVKIDFHSQRCAKNAQKRGSYEKREQTVGKGAP